LLAAELLIVDDFGLQRESDPMPLQRVLARVNDLTELM